MEPVPTFDLYAELEVSPNATTPTIDAAWKSLMKRNHPDLGGARAAERTVRLNIAHDWLADPVRRARYDEELRARSRDVPRAPGPGRVDATSARTPSTPPTAAKPARARAASPPPRVRPRQAHATPVRRGRRPWDDPSRWGDPGRVMLVAAVSLLGIVGLGILVVMGGAGATPRTAATLPAGSLAAGASAVVPPAPSATGSAALPTPTATKVPPPAKPVITMSGSGDHAGVPVTLAGGRYEVSYVVSSAAGESCPWALYLTGSNGLDLLMASAYPVDETVRDAESDSFIAEGKATVRVESGCPQWSATITRTGP